MSQDTETIEKSVDNGAGKEGGEEKVNFGTVLKNRNFRNLLFGQVISQVGDYFAFLAIMVVVAGFSSDTAITTQNVSIVMIATGLPRLLFGVLSGVFVDRWDRRLTMLISDLARPAITLAMIPAFMTQNLALMCVLAFLLSAVGTFFNPAKGALIPKMVPTNQLTAANALSQTSFTFAFVLGPALAGLTFAFAGKGNEWIAFAFDAVSYLVSAFAIWSIRLPKEATQPSLASGSEATEGSAVGRVWQEFLIGIKALALNKAIATLSVVFGVTMLGVGALNVLWTPFLKAYYGFTDSAELGWRFAVLDIAFFAGMVVASVVVGNLMGNRAPKWAIVWGLIIGGAAIAPAVFVPNYWLLAAIQVGVGLAVAPINVGVSTLMQIIVPNSQLGRVGGGIGTVSEVATLTSMSLAGLLGAAIGIPLVFLIAGLLCMAGGVLGFVGLPLLTLKDKVEEETETEDIDLDNAA